MEAFLSIYEAAEKLNVSHKTIRKQIANGKLESGKVGGLFRISESDLQDFYDRSKKGFPKISK